MVNVNNLEATLKKRVDKFNDRISSALNILSKYVNKDPIPDWLDLEGLNPRTGDIGHFRRLGYVYNRVIESLKSIEPDKTENGKLADFKTKVPYPNNLLTQYKTHFKNWVTDHQEDYEKFARPFHLSDVVRRLKDGSELSPLWVSTLDSELFTGCYIHRLLDSELLPEERLLLHKRIWHEVSLYVSRQRLYHDLSTVWWGVDLLKGWETTKLEERIEAVRKLIDLSLSKKEILTEGWKRLISYDRNGDLVTRRRSLVYCHQNAVSVRIWLEGLRNPRLSPLIKMIREWADLCADYWLDIGDQTDLTLYNAALDLAFCANWWKDRVSCWNEAIRILQNGIPDIWNKSTVKGIATTDENFNTELTQLRNTVDKFRKSVNQKKPLVVALFGPPGAGKSKVAKEIYNKASIIELNLSMHETPKELFTTLSHHLHKKKMQILFLDEFDTRLGSEYWYRWLLTLLWDGKFPVVREPNLLEEIQFPSPFAVFLAASRYERFEDFRDFALSPKAKDHKAADLITRIDIHLDIPRLKPADRALVMKKAGQHAGNDVLALCYMAELEDNARGITKLLKGVNLDSSFGLDKLTPAAKDQLYTAAGLPTPT